MARYDKLIELRNRKYLQLQPLFEELQLENSFLNTNIASKETSIKNLQTQVTDLSQQLTQTKALLGQKVDTVNGTATGLGLMQEGNNIESAIRMSQLTGGLRRPYFELYAVGATVVTATEPVKNPFPNQTLSYQVTAIKLYTTSRPGLGTTVTVSYLPAAGGAAVVLFTRTLVLADIPLVNNVLELTGNNSNLARVPVGAKFQAVASAGAFNVLLDGILLKA